MSDIKIENVTKRFGNFVAVNDVSLIVADHEFVVLLGPSGCGKTTLLRAIAGLGMADEGRISIGGKDVTYLPPRERRISMVFQSYAIFPHMNVFDNIAFGLKMQKLDKPEIEKRVRRAAELLHIEAMLDRYPSKMSGGQRQRVAVARAIAMQSQVLLMDEPLSNLDALLRLEMRAELKRLLAELGATTIYVTHDQIEAMAMGDRIVVMSDADVQQVGTPAEVYHDPANLFVARFIGSPGMNLVPGRYVRGVLHLAEGATYKVPDAWAPSLDAATRGDGDLILGFRPEAATVGVDSAIPATVYATDLHGGYTMLHLELGNNTIIHARTTREAKYAINTPVRFDLDPAMVRFFDPATEAAIIPEVRA